MKEIGVSLLCVWGLFIGLALGLHGIEKGAGRGFAQDQWQEFLKDLPGAASAIGYIEDVNFYAGMWDQGELLELTQPRLEIANMLSVALQRSVDFLLPKGRKLAGGMYMISEEGRRKADEDMKALRAAQEGSSSYNAVFSRIENELDAKVEVIKAFEGKYREILGLEISD